MIASSPNDTGPEVSVVIPCYNASTTIGAQLSALATQETSYRWEVVLADNLSTDDLESAVLPYVDRLPDLRIVGARERQGVNHARNVAVREARAERILICDADDEVQPGWLHELADGLRHADLVGGTIDTTKTAPPGGDDLRRGVLDEFGTLGFLPYPIGANCGLRKSVWEDIGGFDESFVLGADEIDFFWRAQLAGHDLRFVRSAQVAYRVRADRAARVRRSYRVSKSTTKLYAKFRPQGFTARPFVVGATRRLGAIALRSPMAVARRGEVMTTWLCEVAALAGRIRGAIEFRVLFF